MRYVCWLLLCSFVTPLSLCATDDYTADERNHWSLRPRGTPVIPQFTNQTDRDWIHNPIDAFILAGLQQAELRPAGESDRRTLIRRVYFDLIGLPPTPAEVEAFVSDTSPAAYELLIDRLLTDPRYGEQWGRHWLDVVRFAETEGFEYDRHLPHAWRYRDYVIRSFQDDKPYDQFLREQLAGDESASASSDQQVAVGFLRWGAIRRNAGNAEVAFSRNEVLTEMTDTIGVALLGMTVGCARCHDHKFDAIRQADYYRLQAFLASTVENEIPLTDATAQAAWKVEADKVSAEIKQLESELDKTTGDGRLELLDKIKAAERRLPTPLPAISNVRNDAANRSVIHILKRGDTARPGDPVGPRVPGVLLKEGSPELSNSEPHPRSRLAEWIVDPQNPLTARVMVNRIWLNHFGRGLVSTPNDFGVNGQPPSHPELLDFLANEFVASGWSIKSLHRLILTSSTYRQASSSPDRVAFNKLDSDNRWLWKFPMRRLQAEEVRDAMLHVSNRLNLKSGGPSVMVPVDAELVDLLYKPSQWMVTDDVTEHSRRAIYLIQKRNLRLPFLEVFDQPTLQSSCPQRESSTHALQALELLNGPLSNQLAKQFAERLESEAGTDHKRQVSLAFQLITGRDPLPMKRDLGLEFLERQTLQEFALAMFNLNEFLYVK